MLKLISLNVEEAKHYSTVVPFLKRENADVICLQEAPEEFAATLKELGYQTSFAPMCKKPNKNTEITVGLIIASKEPHTTRSVYYHQNSETISLYNHENPSQSLRIPYIAAELLLGKETYRIITTHLIVTKNGREDAVQTQIFSNMMSLLASESEHVLCGDFNIPRGYNALYPILTNQYKDNIPLEYKSSLDRNLHKLGNVDIPEKIFDEYMVDYIFTKDSYLAEDVRLEFGVSDHAAVIANIKKVPTQP